MATIVTRAGKGSPLTHVEVDANFTNLNTDKAELASPHFTGIPTAPTATVGTDTTQVATTAFVNAEIANDAPSKTGTGASGTWGISISGDAASVDGKSFGTFTAAGGVAYATDTSTLAATAAGTSGQVLQSNGASAPSWVAVPSPAALSTASGSAPSYSNRAWINFNGTASSIRDSKNVSSMVRNSVGRYTINFTTAMPHANYAVVVGGNLSTGGSESRKFGGIAVLATATGSFQIITGATHAVSIEDYAEIHVSIIC